MFSSMWAERRERRRGVVVVYMGILRVDVSDWELGHATRALDWLILDIRRKRSIILLSRFALFVTRELTVMSTWCQRRECERCTWTCDLGEQTRPRHGCCVDNK